MQNKKRLVEATIDWREVDRNSWNFEEILSRVFLFSNYAEVSAFLD